VCPLFAHKIKVQGVCTRCLLTVQEADKMSGLVDPSSASNAQGFANNQAGETCAFMGFDGLVLFILRLPLCVRARPCQ
jgi:hypothetical protein